MWHRKKRKHLVLKWIIYASNRDCQSLVNAMHISERDNEGNKCGNEKFSKINPLLLYFYLKISMIRFPDLIFSFFLIINNIFDSILFQYAINNQLNSWSFHAYNFNRFHLLQFRLLLSSDICFQKEWDIQ